jgi:hypothetical protein
MGGVTRSWTVETTAWQNHDSIAPFFHGGALPELAEVVALVVDPDESVADTTIADGRSSVGRFPAAMRATSKLTLLGAALVLIAAACGDDDSSPEVSAVPTVADTSTTTATPSTTTAVVTETPVVADVTETYTIPDFGFSIDYPVGWLVETREPVTVITQTEEQLEAAFSDTRTPSTGLGVNLDHRTVAFLQDIGLTADNPTAEDVLEFNTSNFDWTDVQDLGEVEVFGATALVVRVTNPEGDFSVVYQGVRPDTGEVFLLAFGAPTEESLDAFLPVWEAMFESITASP